MTRAVDGEESKGEDVAIKMLRPNSFCRIADVDREIRLLHRLNEDCLIEQHGYCVDDKRNILLVMELCIGSLNNMKSYMDDNEKLTAAIDVADCLSVIHNRGDNSATSSVVHCDVACRNVLKRKNGKFTLSDFGLAQECNGKNLLFIIIILHLQWFFNLIFIF